MRHWFKAREFFMQKGWRPERRAIPYGVLPITWQGWVLTLLWIAAMVVTLVSAAHQGLRVFCYAALATAFGTSAVLWMLRGRVRPARR